MRQFYVQKSDLDPEGGGIGFTDGCKGCRAIIYGKARVGHHDHCRHRVIETASTNPRIAAKVKVAIDRDVRWHALKLEESETRKMEDAQTPASNKLVEAGKRKAEDQDLCNPDDFNHRDSSEPAGCEQPDDAGSAGR